MLPPLQGNLLSQAWALRSYNTDDIGVMFVNGKMVVATGGNSDSDWVKINTALVGNQENVIVVASWNLGGRRAWGFGVRRDDTNIWGSEENLDYGPIGLNYVQRLRLTNNGLIESDPTSTLAPNPPPGKWYIRLQNIQDVGAVLVNGLPVVVGANGSDSDWIEITSQLSATSDNIVTVTAWNFDGPYSYKFDIKRDETIVWGADKTGGGQTGIVLDQPITITGSGEVRP